MSNLNALLEIASSTEVKSVLKDAAGIFHVRAMGATGDHDLTIVVEFRAWDDAILGECEWKDSEEYSELVLYTEIKCKEDHDEFDEVNCEWWNDEINDYMHENITKLPSELQTWVEDTYTSSFLLNGVVKY